MILAFTSNNLLTSSKPGTVENKRVCCPQRKVSVPNSSVQQQDVVRLVGIKTAVKMERQEANNSHEGTIRNVFPTQRQRDAKYDFIKRQNQKREYVKQPLHLKLLKQEFNLQSLYQASLMKFQRPKIDQILSYQIQKPVMPFRNIQNYMDHQMIDQLLNKIMTQNLKFRKQIVNLAIFIGVPTKAAWADDLSYSEFLQAVKDHKIVEVAVDRDINMAQYFFEDRTKGIISIQGSELFKLNISDFVKTLTENGVNLYRLDAMVINKDLREFLTYFVIPLCIIGLVSGPFVREKLLKDLKYRKSGAGVILDPKPDVTFEEVAGIDEAKQEIMELVEFLKTPDIFNEVGAKMPKGALLVGPPGVGKTMLAKAISGEAGVPFVYISASQFVEEYSGVGPARVRDLFQIARKNAPCIVFIDEIDSVAQERNRGEASGAQDERANTINMLLTEMDGFTETKGIIVLAATNNPDVLDKALTRPGRFDRKITVSLPDLEGRIQILKVHSKDKKLSPIVDLKDTAKRCIGFSGAELANILNEAAILSTRQNKTEIEQSDIFEAINKVQLGLKKDSKAFSSARQRLVSYHEAGHALLASMMDEYDTIQQISIVQRNENGGTTIFMPQEENIQSGLYSKQYLLDKICVGMGGRIAEEILNGKDKITSGAKNDFDEATKTARIMVKEMGMSDLLGPRNLKDHNSGPNLQKLVDDEIDNILREQYDRGYQIILQNKNILDKIANTLIEKESLDGQELKQIIKQL